MVMVEFIVSRSAYGIVVLRVISMVVNPFILILLSTLFLWSLVVPVVPVVLVAPVVSARARVRISVIVLVWSLLFVMCTRFGILALLEGCMCACCFHLFLARTAC